MLRMLSVIQGTHKTKIGIYPTPTRPMQDVMCELAENLNPTKQIIH